MTLGFQRSGNVFVLILESFRVLYFFLMNACVLIGLYFFWMKLFSVVSIFGKWGAV